MRTTLLRTIGLIRLNFIRSRSQAGLLAAAIVMLTAASLPAAATPAPNHPATAAGRSATASTQVVVLRAKVNGRFVTAENGGSAALIANRTAADLWERFELTRLSGDNVILRAQANGEFVCAEAAGSRPLISNRSVADLWETFQLIRNSDGSNSLRSLANGRIVTAENAGNSHLIANRSAIALWEKFDVIPQNTTGATPPPSGTKPGPSNTGVPAGTSLTPYTGPRTITMAGTVIDSMDVTGSLRIRAKNVTIRNSKIHDDLGAVAGIYVEDSGSASIYDTEIYNFQVGIVYNNWTATRVNIHDITFDGIKMASNATLRDSWIHQPRPTVDAHWDGVQVQSGVTNTFIHGNVIDATGADTNSALFLAPDLGPSTNGPLTVTGNWLNGGNYTVFANPGGNSNQYFIRDITVKNNRFGHGAKYGPAYVNVPVTWLNNVWEDTGKPVDY